MNVKEKLVSKIERFLLNTILEGEHEGIKIGNFRSKNEGFADAMKSSIDLIKELDSKRYKTVKNEIEWVINSNEPGKVGGFYRRRIKGCFINFDNYSEDKKLVSAYFAGLIIHEATHGLLYTKGVGYEKDRRLQIERICNSEENRFYKKVEREFPEYSGMLIHDFDPNDWEYYWNTSKWKQAYHSLKRILKD
jgi:hypothetical protein